MDKSRKNLKEASGTVLFLAAIALVRLVAELVLEITRGFDPARFDGNVTEAVWMGAMILLAVLVFVALIPQVYIGFKGLKIAKAPNASKAHIVWAVILLVFAVLSLIEPIKALVGGAGDIVSPILTLVLYVIDVVVYGLYLKFACEVRAAA